MSQRGGWRQIFKELIYRGIREQFPEIYSPITLNEQTRIEFAPGRIDRGILYELKEITPHNSATSETVETGTAYVEITEFRIPKKLPVPESWF